MGVSHFIWVSKIINHCLKKVIYSCIKNTKGATQYTVKSLSSGYLAILCIHS